MIRRKIVAFIIGCCLIGITCGKREIEIKNVVGTQCRDCKAVVSAETTLVTMHPDLAKGRITQFDDGIYILNYTATTCEACLEQRKIDGDRLYQEGKKAYQSGDYKNAKQKLGAAVQKGNKDASPWLTKTNERLKAIEKAEKEKLDIATRKAYAKVLREHFLDEGMDIKVRVHGDKSKYITLTYVFIGDVFVHNFKKGSLCDEMFKMGFTRIYLTDGYDYSTYVYRKL